MNLSRGFQQCLEAGDLLFEREAILRCIHLWEPPEKWPAHRRRTEVFCSDAALLLLSWFAAGNKILDSELSFLNRG